MNKSGLIAGIAANAGISKRSAENALNATIKTILDALLDGEKVQLVGVGTFEVKERAPRVARNPKANEPVVIPARRVPCFTPGKAFKNAVGCEVDYVQTD